MALDICNYTPITNCLLQSSNDRFSFLFTQVCNLINSSDSNYVLPIATDTVLGGIIVGDGLSMDPDTGVLSVIPDFIPSLRFGIEDNLSDQDRQFDLGGFTFELFSDTGDITQYGSIFLDNESVSATASNGVTVGGFDAQVNGARIFSNEGDIIKQISTTESAIEVLQTDGIDTYIQTFPLSTGFVVTSVNNVLADEFGNVNIVAVTAGTLQDVTENGPSTTIDLTLASVDITGLALDGDEGTNGQLLVSAGPGNTPVWVNPSVIPSSDLQTVTNSGPSTTNNLSLASINITGLTLSGSGGTANQVLITNGSGVPSWSSLLRTFQNVTDAGNTSTNAISIGAATAPLSLLDIYNTNLTTFNTTSGIRLTNTSSSVNTIPQRSPSLYFSGQVYEPFAGISRDVSFVAYNLPVQTGSGIAAAAKLSKLRFSSDDSGAEIVSLELNSDGSITAGNGLILDKYLTLPRLFGTSIQYQASSTSGIHHTFANQLGSVFSGTIMNITTGFFTNSKGLVITGNFSDPVLTTLSNGTVGINTLTPNIRAALDVQSIGKVFMPPRMTQDQIDGIPLYVVSIPVTTGGSNYTIPPTVAVAASPMGGIIAKVDVVLTLGVVTSVDVLYGGTGYNAPVSVTLTTNPTDPNIGIIVPATLGTMVVGVGTTPTGSFVYNTNINKLQLYTGSAWETITSV